MQLDFQDLQLKYLEWARLLHNDPDVLNMLTDPHEVTQEEQIQWFKSLCNNPKSRRVVALVNDSPVGLIRLDQIDYNNNSVCVGLDIAKEYRGQGLSYPIYSWIFEEFFIKTDFNRIWLLVAAYNKKAYNLYQKLGFKEEGIQRQALYRFNEYNDSIMMSFLRNEFLAKRCI